MRRISPHTLRVVEGSIRAAFGWEAYQNLPVHYRHWLVRDVYETASAEGLEYDTAAQTIARRIDPAPLASYAAAIAASYSRGDNYRSL